MKNKKMIRVAAMVAVLAVLVSVVAPMGVWADTPTIWDGSIADGFESGTGTENDPYIIKTGAQLAYLAQTVNNGTNYEGKYFKLGNDIVLNDTLDWENWETSAPKNTWTPIGGEHYRFSGIFDGDGHTVSGVYINTTDSDQGLFGYSYGTIRNVGIKDSYIIGGTAVGGVIGVSRGRSLVENCYNAGTVSGEDDVGGVVGINGDSVGKEDAIVIGCYNTGNVNSTGAYVGGVVGYNSIGGTVKDCYNTGDVSGKDDVGGVIGVSEGTSLVENCYNAGTVSGEDDVGGVVGSTLGDIDDWAEFVTITNCYNTGSVSGKAYVGGVVGNNDGTVENSYNTGSVSGEFAVGGVVGEENSGSFNVISNCYNTGEVIGTGEFSGGVVGRAFIRLGTVSNCYNMGPVSGDIWVGSVVGGIGGNMEENKSAVENCYYLIDSAKDGKGTTQNGIGHEMKGKTTEDAIGCTKGLTEEQMKQQSSYEHFNFYGNWMIDAEVNGGYPFLGAPKTDSLKAANGFASGTGTENDPYLIETAEQFAFLAESVNEGNEYSGKFIRLTNDIVLNDLAKQKQEQAKTVLITWTAIGNRIGNRVYCFSGNFDGDGHTVSGVYINTTDSDQGLFGYSDGIIRNVGIKDSYIIGGGCVGGVVGSNAHGTVENCYNTGNVNSTGADVGGVVGSNVHGTVENCYNTGNVNSTGACVGGVVGYNSTGGTVKDCYNTGDVSGELHVGGVVGYNGDNVGEEDTIVIGCYNTGNVNGTGACVGGVVGESHANEARTYIDNCYNTGDVSGEFDVGGIVGNGGSCWCANCYNTGNVSGKDTHIGGIAGSGDAENCYNTGNVNGRYAVGGVVGYGNAEKCFNTGTINGDTCVGGVAGSIFGGVRDCYYLNGCAKDGSGMIQNGIGNEEQGKVTEDVSGETKGLNEEEMKEHESKEKERIKKSAERLKKRRSGNNFDFALIIPIAVGAVLLAGVVVTAILVVKKRKKKKALQVDETPQVETNGENI